VLVVHLFNLTPFEVSQQFCVGVFCVWVCV
jgi:hypothetical protein